MELHAPRRRGRPPKVRPAIEPAPTLPEDHQAAPTADEQMDAMTALVLIEREVLAEMREVRRLLTRLTEAYTIG